MWRKRKPSNRPRISSNQPMEPRRYHGTFAYKYRSVEHMEWLEQILLEDKLYFPTASEINDPEEARPQLAPASVERQIEMLSRLRTKGSPHLTNEGLTALTSEIAAKVPSFGAQESIRMMKQLLDSLFSTIRIYSLSKRPDNYNLWKNYAGNHTGYCLEFRNKNLPGPIWEVRYANTTLDITEPEQANGNFLYYKTPHWSEEEEVRMINPRNSECTVIFDPRRLTRLILGTKIAPENEKQIRKWAAVRELPLPIISEQDLLTSGKIKLP